MTNHSSTPPLILVAGATGYIASRLIPSLLDSGHRVRALARDPRRLQSRGWSPFIEIVQADVMDPTSLAPALKDVHTAYYLIHNMSSGHGYTAFELDGARNFASAAQEAGVQHIIYLGGLADPEQHIAPHMRSRIETGKVLREGSVPVTEFRAGVIAGSGSISFEMIRFMTELFPLIPAPSWIHNKSQPIAIQNIIDYLLAALENRTGQGQVFEIGGPEITTYKDLMLRYARLRGLKRNMLILPRIPLSLMAFGIDLMTPVHYPIARALIGGLSTDSIVQHPNALKVFPEVRLIGFDEAVQTALNLLSPKHIECVWLDDSQKGRFIKHEGSLIYHRGFSLDKPREDIFHSIGKFAEEKKWKIEFYEDGKFILVSLFESAFGNEWIEWRASQNVTPTCSTHLTQTTFFSPRGLGGFLYWYLLYPFHLLRYRSLIQRITRQLPPLHPGTGRSEAD